MATSALALPAGPSTLDFRAKPLGVLRAEARRDTSRPQAHDREIAHAVLRTLHEACRDAGVPLWMVRLNDLDPTCLADACVDAAPAPMQWHATRGPTKPTSHFVLEDNTHIGGVVADEMVQRGLLPDSTHP